MFDLQATAGQDKVVVSTYKMFILVLDNLEWKPSKRIAEHRVAHKLVAKGSRIKICWVNYFHGTPFK